MYSHILQCLTSKASAESVTISKFMSSASGSTALKIPTSAPTSFSDTLKDVRVIFSGGSFTSST